jgi:hypothetical protein
MKIEEVNYLKKLLYQLDSKTSLICECSCFDFKQINDVSMPESTAVWMEYCNCGKKYDVRVNLISQKYLQEIESQ